MKKVITKPHPNIFAWIEFIQGEEAVTNAKIQSFRSGATARPLRQRTGTSFVSLCIRLGRVLIIVYAVGELSRHMVLIIVYHPWWF